MSSPNFFNNDDLYETPQPAKVIENPDILKATGLSEIKLSNPNLNQIVDNILKGNEPTDIELQQLNDVEKAFLLKLKEKKDTKKIEESDEINFLNENHLNFNNRKKRMEENQKLFFKKAFSFIDNNFFRSKIKNKKKIQKRHKNYEEFYQFYFGEISKTIGVQIENFFHPQKKIEKFKKNQNNTKKKNNSKKENFNNNLITPGLKSFNKTYIDLILRSKKFKSDLEYYLENEFRKNCEENRKKKIFKFLNHCNKQIDNCIQNNFILPFTNQNLEKIKNYTITTINNYILLDGKAKLPWSNLEINEAYILCKKMLNDT